ncbi:DUF362 domain-containing protein [Salidesulfovibrio onnuriiensis]|uniref:DUF362 domain-containing protein n=1 Tax=Salidesulfovibrio onnuriiensis TaxID=2583823 RepID=UPI0011CA719F|nr:DUF362 domain-containing protein [Salidesulfovibrio onnuriiensis]
MTTRVAIARILEYESTLLEPAVGVLLEEAGYRPVPGRSVLVKPNLVNATNAKVSCTNALVVRAVCACLLDGGERVTVADSPAFGPAPHVARAAGIAEAIAPLGLKVQGLRNPRPTKLPCGLEVGLSATALNADLIVNVPRLKAHIQMRLTGAVKNLFGCVVGFRKAFAHNQLGEKGTLFREMIMDIPGALPPTLTLMDAIRPMHETGPARGRPFPLGMLAASANPVALDTAAYVVLGAKPAMVPLWEEALKRGLPGARPEDLIYPLEKPAHFKAEGFVIPQKLDPVKFELLRLIRGRFKSLLRHLGKKA